MRTRTWTVDCPTCFTRVKLDSAAGGPCPTCGTLVAPEGVATRIGRAHRRAKAQAAKSGQDSLVGQSLGSWQLVRLIGKGGMGRVYEARGSGSGRGRGRQRRVAIKVLSEDLANDPAFVKRFHREAKVLSSLAHPHVVQMLDRGEDNGRLWFAMEFVRGDSLRRRMERGPLPVDEAVRISAQIASALHYAHEQGIVHRDLKPENVLIDERGTVRLVDFGLSQLAQPQGQMASTRLTRTDVILGTYEYMSPEQRRGERSVDGRADVFALGVILYEMLTGTLPLGRFAQASKAGKDVPSTLDAVVDQALAPEQKQRYESAEAFQQSLLQALEAGRRESQHKSGVVHDFVDLSRPLNNAAYRRIQRHVDIFATLDKVAGVLCLIAGVTGGAALLALLGVEGRFAVASSLVGIGGLGLLILGSLLVRQGNRLAQYEPSARQAQVVWSVFMLFFPPVLTIIGIYGLIVLTSDRFREGYRLARLEHLGGVEERSIPQRVVQFVAPERRPQDASWLLRVLHFCTIVWCLVAGFHGLELFMSDSLNMEIHSLYDTVSTMRDASIIAAFTALVLCFHLWIKRQERRGLGLAAFAFLLLTFTSVFLTAAAGHGKALGAIRESGSARSELPRPIYALDMAPNLETSK